MSARARVEELAVALQRAKMFMELKGLQNHHWNACALLSKAIYSLEASAGLSAPSLRDQEDGR